MCSDILGFRGKARTATRYGLPKVILAAAAILSPLVFPHAADAQTIALTSNRGTGNQAFTGPLGMDFSVAAGGITVTRLGAFDSGQNGFASAISVGIFSFDTQTIVAGLSASLTTANTVAVGQSRFFDIGDVFLSAGNYTIVAVGYGPNEANGNAGFGGAAPTINSGGGVVNFFGTGRYLAGTTTLSFPTTVDSGPANRYDAGTFEFVAGTAAPEPGSLALLLPVVGAIGIVMRRRRK